MVEASAYVTLTGKRGQYGPVNETTGLRDVTGMRATRIAQSRPSKMGRDEIAVKVRLRLPAAVFDPIMPSAVITIPEDAVIRGDIEIEAVVEDQT